MREKKEFVLGYLKLTNRILMIDPCYRYLIKGSTDGISRRCAPGNWQFTYVAQHGYGEKFVPYQLIATFEGFDSSAPQDYKIVQHRLAVDSATLGIFDFDHYPLLGVGDTFVQPKNIRDDFESRRYSSHTVLESAGFMSEGALSYTCWGDGHHRAKLWMNKHRQAERAVIYLDTQTDCKDYGLYRKEVYE